MTTRLAHNFSSYLSFTSPHSFGLVTYICIQPPLTFFDNELDLVFLYYQSNKDLGSLKHIVIYPQSYYSALSADLCIFFGKRTKNKRPLPIVDGDKLLGFYLCLYLLSLAFSMSLKFEKLQHAISRPNRGTLQLESDLPNSWCYKRSSTGPDLLGLGRSVTTQCLTMPTLFFHHVFKSCTAGLVPHAPIITVCTYLDYDPKCVIAYKEISYVPSPIEIRI